MGCAADEPIGCECKRTGTDPLLIKIQTIQQWCNPGEDAENGCCYTIGDSYSSLGLTYQEYNCKLPDPVLVSAQPDLCKIPCSDSFPENCECEADSTDMTLKDIYQWCTFEKPQCCSSILNDYAEYNYTPVDMNCKVLNQTMVQLYPDECKIPSLPDLNWRFPITSGIPCFTTVPGLEGLTYINQSASLGDGFVCMNYITWYEPLNKYVVVATTGDSELYDSMSLYPNTYMNLTECSTDHCNDPSKLQESLDSFQPELSGLSGPGLSCFQGVYPNIISTFVYNADICVRYSFQPNYNSSIVTIYNGIPSSLLLQLQETLFAQNVTSCSTSNCNEIIAPTDSSNPSFVLSPNESGDLNCFVSIESGDIVLAHPNPKANAATKYCLKVTSVLDSTTLYFSASSYEPFSSYSKTSSISICNTSLCNTPTTGSKNLKCYLTNPASETENIKSDLILSVDYCVKYRTTAGIKIYSGVNSDQLALITSNPSKFTDVDYCQTDYCLVPWFGP